MSRPSLEELAEAFAGPPPPPPSYTDIGSYEYEPPFSPSQREFYLSKARYCLATGERFSGKSWTAAHKIVKHAYSHWNAHVIVIVPIRRMATAGGIWYKLLNEVMPEWARNQPGFEHTEQKQNTEKDLYVWTSNKFGGWSMIQLVSIPHASTLADRVRGIEASMIYIDELTTTGGPEYFDAMIQQIGRRPHIPTEEQQYVSSTNPSGTSHWVYKRFLGDSSKLADGTKDPRYHVVHIPITDNPDPRAKEYYTNVMDATRNDPIEYRRLVLGEWIDRPSGDAIFAAYFSKPIHVRGDVATRSFLIPKSRIPITLGYDLGDVNHGIIFLQSRPTEDREVWLAFDEITVNRTGVSFDILVPALLDKMQYWCEACEYDFTFQHISDKSAFNRFRSASGSYDHLQIERISRELLAENPERWPNLRKPVRMLECPKPPGSVAGRIKTLMNLLSREEIYFSAKCQRLIEAIANIESEDGEPFEPSRKGDHVHPYDALTYALYYHTLNKVRAPANGATPTVRQFGGN